MERFARHTRENLSTWQVRAAELAQEPELSADSSGTPLAWPSQAPNDFLTAFPPALPDSFRIPEETLYPSCYHPLHHRYSSVDPSTSSSSSTASQYESCESSLPSPAFSPILQPTPVPTSPTSATLPSRLELSNLASLTHPHSPLAHPHSRAPSVVSTAPSASSGSVFSITNEATAAIRAAYKASVRKKKSFHRSSWNPSPTPFSGLSPIVPPTQQFIPSSHIRSSPVSPTGGDDGPMSLGAVSPSTGTLTPSPLTSDANATTARSMVLKTTIVSAS